MAYAPSIPSFGGLTVNRATAAGATAFATMVRPYTPDGLPVQSGQKAPGRIHLTSLLYESPAARHNIALMRPLNYTTFSAAAAASQAVVNITADPGNYASNYKYPVPAGWVQRTANNLIAGGDYVMYQCPDGTWVLDTVASVSTLAITMTTNVPTGGVLAGGLFYWFGIHSDTDPATGDAHLNFDAPIAASATVQTAFTDPANLWCVLHGGDPMVIYSSNITTQGYLQYGSGFYSRH